MFSGATRWLPRAGVVALLLSLVAAKTVLGVLDAWALAVVAGAVIGIGLVRTMMNSMRGPRLMPLIRLAREFASGMAGNFVQRSGTGLTLNNLPYTFTGFNMPYLMHSWGDDLNTALTSWGSHLTVARIFAFQTFNIVSGAINWTKLDGLMATFAAHGVKVILVLGNNVADGTNDDGALKDLTWWQGGYSTQVQSAQVVTYREYVRQIVTRYASNPTVAMWQLVNEGQAINRNGSCTEATALAAELAFANDVGGLIKSIDSNHLVSLGVTSGMCGSDNGDYQTLYASPCIDVCDYHDYNHPNSPMGLTEINNGLQGTIDHCHADGKAIMVGETGIDWTSTPAFGQPPISPNTLAERATLFQAKVSAQFTAGIVGMCVWSSRNNPVPADGGDYGYEVGPGDPSLSVLGAF